MLNQLLDYEDYKEYIINRIEIDPLKKGLKNKISEFIQCQPSYLSQVLNGFAHLTLEQAHRLNVFFHHTASESRYFLLLVEKDRSGSVELKDFFLLQIREMQQAKFNIKKRLAKTDDIPEKDRHRYYSTWFYSAIHVALSVPENQSAEILAQKFHLPEALVYDVIHFLEEIGLIEKVNNQFKVTNRSIHLGRDSEFVQRHHINWRSQCLQSVEKNLEEDMHYSSVIAISLKDAEKIKELWLECIDKMRKIIKPSKEEEVFALTMDFFKVKGL